MSAASGIGAPRPAAPGAAPAAGAAQDAERRRREWRDALERELQRDWVGVVRGPAPLPQPAWARSAPGARPQVRAERGNMDAVRPEPSDRAQERGSAGQATRAAAPAGGAAPLREGASVSPAERGIVQPVMIAGGRASPAPGEPAAAVPGAQAIEAFSLPWLPWAAPAASGCELATAPPGETAAPAPAARSTALAPEPIRCHAEWTAEGVRLWLGIDAGAIVPAPALVEVLVSELRRWAEARGARVLGIVCNGREVAGPSRDTPGLEAPLEHHTPTHEEVP